MGRLEETLIRKSGDLPSRDVSALCTLLNSGGVSGSGIMMVKRATISRSS
ncbi:hypothetical protein TR2A62_0279 [Thalassobium sp. R2A62]|nr:hypothetical protein TR2A62_0279 [Thalassobium sp. R2A62]